MFQMDGRFNLDENYITSKLKLPSIWNITNEIYIFQQVVVHVKQ